MAKLDSDVMLIRSIKPLEGTGQTDCDAVQTGVFATPHPITHGREIGPQR